ncbi:MAG: hypothetical protein IJR90_00115 [Clostridia bacterium]|nr:hypothetical protein [Clostridia bacterium]
MGIARRIVMRRHALVGVVQSPGLFSFRKRLAFLDVFSLLFDSHHL